MPEERAPVWGRHLWGLVAYVRPYRARVVAGLASNGAARLFDLLPMVIIGRLVDMLAEGRATTPGMLGGIAVLVLGTFIGLALFQSVSDYCWDTLAQKVRHDLRVRLYGHLQSLDVGQVEERSVGDLMAVVASDVDNLENFLADATTSMVRLAVTFVGTFAFLLWLDWRLALLLFAPLPVAVVAVRYFTTRVQPQYRRIRQSVGAMNTILENNLQGLPVIQAHTAQQEQMRRVTAQSADYRDAAVAAAVSRARFIPVFYLVAGVAYALLVGVGGWMVLEGMGPSLGDYVAFLLFAMRLIMPLFILGMLFNQIQRSEASMRRVQEVLELQPRVSDRPDAQPLEGRPARLEARDVHFAYPGRPAALAGVSFAVERGGMVGIVGPTGAGKSTLLKLLLRMRDPDGGQVLVDGRDARDVRLDDLRRQVAYVSQEPYIFPGSVRDNITLGRPDATDGEVEAAARAAGAHDFVAALPQGYATEVGERGVRLSGGQRQRVSLARALLRRSAILLLDEATSAVDSRTEEAIRASLERERGSRMTVAVAHRLSTVRNADLILVLVDGVVVERGRHADLLRHGGVYADLWRVQVGEGRPGGDEGGDAAPPAPGGSPAPRPPGDAARGAGP